MNVVETGPLCRLHFTTVSKRKAASQRDEGWSSPSRAHAGAGAAGTRAGLRTAPQLSPRPPVCSVHHVRSSPRPPVLAVPSARSALHTGRPSPGFCETPSRTSLRCLLKNPVRESSFPSSYTRRLRHLPPGPASYPDLLSFFSLSPLCLYCWGMNVRNTVILLTVSPAPPRA